MKTISKATLNFSFFLLSIFAVSILNGQIITTVAGTGSGSYSGDGGPATNAAVQRPIEIHIDDSANIYIADNDNHRVRIINGASGIINTIAGNGSLGFSGDGGPATDASLNLPTAVCTDPSGNIYISDKSNQRIRKIDFSTGIINTIAGDGTGSYSGDGGPSTAATISQPHGMQTDAAGNLYFADRTNHRIRRIDNSTSIITTVAGTGNSGYSGDGAAATDANLNFPMSLCIDPAGNIYIADQINHRIRKIDASTGIITTIAGAGSPGFSGDGGLAINAELNQPYDVSIDDAGDLYISDTNNQRIRKVNSTTGIISTLGGNGSGGYSGDGGPATDASMNFPSGIFSDADGNVYIGDKLNHRVRKINSCITSATINETACFSYTTPSGNDTYTASGTYTDIIPNAESCDSIITINLTINTVDISVSLNGTTLSANAQNATYQWLDCDNGFAIIPNETGQSFTPMNNGSYAVAVSEFGCTDTSACNAVIVVGLDELTVSNKVKLFPNPTSGKFIIDLENAADIMEIKIVDILGRLVYKEYIQHKKIVDIELDQNDGVYFALLKYPSGIIVQKIVKQ